MSAIRQRRGQALTAVAAALAVVAAGALGGGCGGSGAGTVRYPAGTGSTMTQIRAGHAESAVLAPSTEVLQPGPNRFGFALLDNAHKFVNASSVALYTSDRSGQNVQGPFPASQESLAVAPRFQSRTVAGDPGAAHFVYVGQVSFARCGPALITALADVGGHEIATTLDQFTIGPKGPQPPGVGQRAIPVHTPTVAQTHGRPGLIDTRSPPATDLQQLDFARVLGRRPVVLMFATPALCQSRVCGPVVDIEEQVKAHTGPRMAFIHMEIYRNNNPTDGLRPQVRAWRLATEPWTFVIDRRGRIAARLEGALSAAELQAAVDRVLSR